MSKDQALLEQLPDAFVKFLVEPQRQQLNDELWDQPWDILFFAGHSSTISHQKTRFTQSLKKAPKISGTHSLQTESRYERDSYTSIAISL